MNTSCGNEVSDANRTHALIDETLRYACSADLQATFDARMDEARSTALCTGVQTARPDKHSLEWTVRESTLHDRKLKNYMKARHVRARR